MAINRAVLLVALHNSNSWNTHYVTGAYISAQSNKIYNHNQVAMAAPLHSLQICFHIIWNEMFETLVEKSTMIMMLEST